MIGSFSFSFLVLYFFLALGSTTTYVLSSKSSKAIYLQLFTSQNALKEFTFDLRSLLWYHLLHPVTPWCHSNIAPFCSRAILNAYATNTWQTKHLVKLCHLNLPCYLGLTPTSKGVGLIPDVDIPSGPRFCHPILPSIVFWPNRRPCLVWSFNARYLGLTPTSKGVGLIPDVDFPSGPRFCHPILPSLVF
jgi:hypothetical protein